LYALYDWNLVVVHAEERGVYSGHGLDEALVGSGQLEFAEEASGDASSGGTAETDLKDG